MPELTYRGVAYEAAPQESVLDTLLRHGIGISNSCRAGACQSCMLRAAPGAVPAVAQQGLKSTLVEQGYFLSCVCHPENDLVVEPPEGLDVTARIASLERLSPTVLCLRVRPDNPFVYRAGQYITLRRQDGLARSYSLASLPHEATLELHIRRAPQGRMTGWLFEEARTNDVVIVRGPAGECFYMASSLEQPLLLVGTGTGLAPLVGICRDALRQGHRGPIELYHGALGQEGLYLQQELRDLAREHRNLRYHPVVLKGGGQAIRSGSLDRVVLEDHAKLNGWRGYVCGSPDVVGMLKKVLFLAGVASCEIFSDAFVEAPLR